MQFPKMLILLEDKVNKGKTLCIDLTGRQHHCKTTLPEEDLTQKCPPPPQHVMENDTTKSNAGDLIIPNIITNEINEYFSHF